MSLGTNFVGCILLSYAFRNPSVKLGEIKNQKIEDAMPQANIVVVKTAGLRAVAPSLSWNAMSRSCWGHHRNETHSMTHDY